MFVGYYYIYLYYILKYIDLECVMILQIQFFFDLDLEIFFYVVFDWFGGYVVVIDLVLDFDFKFGCIGIVGV